MYKSGHSILRILILLIFVWFWNQCCLSLHICIVNPKSKTLWRSSTFSIEKWKHHSASECAKVAKKYKQNKKTKQDSAKKKFWLMFFSSKKHTKSYKILWRCICLVHFLSRIICLMKLKENWFNLFAITSQMHNMLLVECRYASISLVNAFFPSLNFPFIFDY